MMPLRAIFVVASALVLHLRPATVQAQVAEQDSLALMAFYHATNGDNWRNNSGWLTGPVRTWIGVNLNSWGPGKPRVERLVLNSNNLTGSLPEELSNLDELKILQVIKGRLTGDVMKILPKLPALREVWLIDNLFTGALSPELSRLRHLRRLDLTHNQFSGAIPATWGDFESLETLQLTGNNLTGEIPESLGRLKSLRYLSLAENHLSGPIPPSLGRLTELHELRLSYNPLTGSVPEEIGRMAALEWLVLRSTDLSGLLPLSLIELKNLSIFEYSNTQLCKPPHPSFMQWLQNIKHVATTACTGAMPTASEDAEALPDAFALEPNYPNPFNPATTIRYALPQPSAVRLAVYDALGRRVALLVDAVQPAGHYDANFEAGDLPSGVYFYRLEAGDFRETGRMVLLR